jgi:hypothetical protein
MATATKKTTGKSAGTMPQWKGLAIDVKCELTKENAAAVDCYHSNCCQFEADVATLFDQRETLLAGALDTTLRHLIAEGAALNESRRSLEDKLALLRWERVELLPELLPEFAAELKAAEAAHEKTIADEMARFEAAGAGLAAMPAAHKHSKGAERQLRHRVMQEVPCMAAFGRLQTARHQIAALEGQRHSVPSESSCLIIWPPADGIGAEIARLAGIQ